MKQVAATNSGVTRPTFADVNSNFPRDASGHYMAGPDVGTTLTILGSEAAPLVGPSVIFYEKAFDYIKSTYEQIDNRLNSIQWWGGQFGF